MRFLKIKYIKHLLLLILLFIQVLGSAYAQTKIKIACIGNSITFGTGLDKDDEERINKSYPFKLEGLLNQEFPGKDFEVENYAVPGTTILKNLVKDPGEVQLSYWDPKANKGQFDAALKFNPDILIIKFGTNDARDANWPSDKEDGKNNFYKHYVEFINSFRAVNPNVTVYICYTLPSERKDEQARVIRNEVIPTIKQIARKNNVYLIDLHSEFYDGLNKGLILGGSDKIHPTEAGATLIANEVFKAIKMNIK